jgi:hypothetical protein
MSGSTQAWSQSEDPREHTVGPPRADLASPATGSGGQAARPVVSAQGSAARSRPAGPGPASSSPQDGFEATSMPGGAAGNPAANGPARPREPDGLFGTARPAAGSLADLRSRLARLPYGHPSSPYDDGGAAKLPPPRLRQLELGLPAPEREPANGAASDGGLALAAAVDVLAEFRNGHDPELARTNAVADAAAAADRDVPIHSLDVPTPGLEALTPDPEELTPDPDPEVLTPDRSRPIPDAGGSATDPGARIPDPGARIPEAGGSATDPGARIPDPGARIPEAGGSATDPGARIPDPGARIPEAGGSATDPGARIPDPGAQVPDVVAPAPGLDAQVPDVVAPAPDLAPLPDPLDGHRGVVRWPRGDGSARRADDSTPARYSTPLAKPDGRPGQNGNGRQHGRNDLQDPYATLQRTDWTINGAPGQPPRDEGPAPRRPVSPPPLSDAHGEVVRSALAACRTAEGRNMFGNYGDRGITPAVMRVAQQLPHGRLAPDSEADSLKSADRFAAKLARLVARFPGTPAEQLAATICDAIRYAFVFEPADYTEGTLLVHRKLKVQGFELEARRNRWDSPEFKGIWTCWRDPAHDQPFEVQFHTTASWDVVRQTHDSYVRITNPATAPAERARLRARQVAAAAAATSPPRCGQIADFRLEPR